MSPPPPEAVGAPDAAFVAALWHDLRRLAGTLLTLERPEHTLVPSSLVNEAFLYLLRHRELLCPDGGNRALALAAVVMRNILRDHARRRSAAKRGGGWCRVELHTSLAVEPRDYEVVAVRDALDALHRVNGRAGVVVTLWLLGHSLPEIAGLTGTSLSTVECSWRFARAWLRQELGDQPAREGGGTGGNDSTPLPGGLSGVR